MLLKLRMPDPSEFDISESYWSDDNWFQFEGFLRDDDLCMSYSGELYGDERYFTLHSVFYPNQTMDHRETDIDRCDTHPWVLIISGDHTLLGVFKRFKTYADLCDWFDNPVFSDIYYVY